MSGTDPTRSDTSVMLRYPRGSPTPSRAGAEGGRGRSRCGSNASRAVPRSAALANCVAQPLTLAPPATTSVRNPPGVSCITLVNSSSRSRSAMSARFCQVPFHPAATASGIDDPYSSAAITRRACACDTTPYRAAAATPVARRSISARVNRPFPGIRGSPAASPGPSDNAGAPTAEVIVTPGMCAARDHGRPAVGHAQPNRSVLTFTHKRRRDFAPPAGRPAAPDDVAPSSQEPDETEKYWCTTSCRGTHWYVVCPVGRSPRADDDDHVPQKRIVGRSSAVAPCSPGTSRATSPSERQRSAAGGRHSGPATPAHGAARSEGATEARR